MQWLRNWLKRPDRAAKVSSSPSTAFRPRVESLDERVVPTVSSVVTAGATFTVAVSDTNNLIAIDPSTGAVSQLGFTNVRTAQLFRDGNGNLGADIIFRDGSWTHIDGSFGGTTTFTAAQAQAQFGGKILDAGTAYDSSGNIRLDILVANTANTDRFALGHIMEFNAATGGGLVDLSGALGTSVRWVSTYESIGGGTGIALSQLTAGAGTPTNLTDDQLLVRKADFATGVSVLYSGDGVNPAAVVEYSQSVFAPSTSSLLGPPTVTSLSVVIDVTLEGLDTIAIAGGSPTATEKGYALQFTSSASTSLGGTASANVVAVIASTGGIRTGVIQTEP